METNRVTRALIALASLAYYGLLVGAALVLVGSLIVKLVAPENGNWTWGLEVAAESAQAPAAVATDWGGARLEVEDLRGSLRLPIGRLPWWLLAILWTHLAAAFLLMLLVVHHLRRLFQRVRDGAPFDARNAQRLRWAGMSLLALAVLNGAASFVTAVAVRRGLSPASPISVPLGLPIDGSLVFSALMLLALASVFRRGSDLEHEQSLVV
jgi:hypothetical protein